MTKHLPLRDGSMCLVDDDVFAWAARFRWGLGGNADRYVARVQRVKGRNTTIYLHRVIVGAAPSEQVDHINHDTLDNRRANLRAVNASENGQNRLGVQRNSTTGVRGVTRDRRRGRFVAQLGVNGHHYYLGSFRTLREAALAAAAGRATYMTHAAESGLPLAVALPDAQCSRCGAKVQRRSRELPDVERFCSAPDCAKAGLRVAWRRYRQRQRERRGPLPPTLTGIRGVDPDARGGFRARISVRGHRHFLGRFKTPELAQEAITAFLARLETGQP